ncbi:hypothetical protein K1719_038136 [Acacia pycnantha]|nr:hypothetical protein K1719_045236 [Acacia pycnantha]KAI9079890.1 hypothetical protein K1719_038136 [Acacia pycnantha]
MIVTRLFNEDHSHIVVDFLSLQRSLALVNTIAVVYFDVCVYRSSIIVLPPCSSDGVEDSELEDLCREMERTEDEDESKQVGLKVGFEVGEELGFYRGCVDVWSSAIQVDPNCFSSRVKISTKQMDELIEKYPVLDPENLQVREIMDSLRLKFKMVCSSLHMKKDYDGYPKSSSDMMFEKEYSLSKKIID